MDSNNFTELCLIAYKYGTDKCPQIKHAYTPFYYQLLKDRRNTIKKVLEIGIGGRHHDWTTTNVIYDPKLKRYYHRAASLYMWREFFPNAHIYGADNAPETLVQDERLTTYLCDERKKEDIEQLIAQTGQDVDIFIDDASHDWKHQAFLARIALPLLTKDVLYIIEDVGHPYHLLNELKQYIYYYPKLPQKIKKAKDKIIIINNK